MRAKRGRKTYTEGKQNLGEKDVTNIFNTPRRGNKHK